MQRTRAWRRRQRRRIEQKRKRSGHWAWSDTPEDRYSAQPLPPEIRQRYVDTPTHCSCPICGNLRHLEGKTRQECIADQIMEEELNTVQ